MDLDANYIDNYTIRFGGEEDSIELFWDWWCQHGQRHFEKWLEEQD